jgi:hypothetical protein
MGASLRTMRRCVEGIFLACSWDDFQAYVDEREPKMLRAFTSLEVNPAGQYDLKHIKSELPRWVLPLLLLHLPGLYVYIQTLESVSNTWKREGLR